MIAGDDRLGTSLGNDLARRTEGVAGANWISATMDVTRRGRSASMCVSMTILEHYRSNALPERLSPHPGRPSFALSMTIIL
ncbi:hypothetical protein FHT86_002960 [Rhizobium sp. BK313]|nr:hypothetical protein [Rhizobium sp. BK313]